MVQVRILAAEQAVKAGVVIAGSPLKALDMQFKVWPRQWSLVRRPGQRSMITTGVS